LVLSSPEHSYKLSIWAAREASKLFARANLPFTRPNDYYAEMLKSDEHMEKIRQKLLDDSANIKASEQAKKQRHLKKFGKQVQVEKQKEREKSKKDMNDKVKSFRKSEFTVYHTLFCPSDEHCLTHFVTFPLPQNARVRMAQMQNSTSVH
jgi:hypothetical protein